MRPRLRGGCPGLAEKQNADTVASVAGRFGRVVVLDLELQSCLVHAQLSQMDVDGLGQLIGDLLAGLAQFPGRLLPAGQRLFDRPIQLLALLSLVFQPFQPFCQALGQGRKPIGFGPVFAAKIQCLFQPAIDCGQPFGIVFLDTIEALQR